MMALVAQPGFRLADAGSLIATAELSVQGNQRAFPESFQPALRSLFDQRLDGAGFLRRGQTLGQRQHHRQLPLIAWNALQQGTQGRAVLAALGDFAQQGLPGQHRHQRGRQRIAFGELAQQFEYAIPVFKPLIRAQFQTQRGNVTAFPTLQTPQHGQRGREVAGFDEHFGFQHQRRRFCARVLRFRLVQPCLLAHRIAQALRRTGRDQGCQRRRPTRRMRLIRAFQRLTIASFKQKTHGVLEHLSRFFPSPPLLIRTGPPGNTPNPGHKAQTGIGQKKQHPQQQNREIQRQFDPPLRQHQQNIPAVAAGTPHHPHCSGKQQKKPGERFQGATSAAAAELPLRFSLRKRASASRLLRNSGRSLLISSACNWRQ